MARVFLSSFSSLKMRAKTILACLVVVFPIFFVPSPKSTKFSQWERSNYCLLSILVKWMNYWVIINTKRKEHKNRHKNVVKSRRIRDAQEKGGRNASLLLCSKLSFIENTLNCDMIKYACLAHIAEFV